jgi:molecular chaperone DnaK (HSP70)
MVLQITDPTEEAENSNTKKEIGIDFGTSNYLVSYFGNEVVKLKNL